MAIYALGDPHLSSAQPKPMDIFGPAWQGHAARLFANWQQVVGPDDAVLVPGDISWAMTLDEALPDLQAIDALPGRKFLISGNHDYWWESISRIRRLGLPSLTFIQNDHAMWGEVAICGTRLWLPPGDRNWAADPAHNAKVWARELQRLQLSLQSARKAGAAEIIVMLHYPPADDRLQPTEAVQILRETPAVRDVVYGHLHGWQGRPAYTGEHDGITYRLVACDYVDFTPVLVRR